jgi:hypothetical protein
MLKKAVQRSVKRESSNMKGFGARAFGIPTFHLSRLTFHGFMSETRTMLADFWGILPIFRCSPSPTSDM